VPPLNLQQLQPQEVTLTPEQRRSLNDATAGLEVAEAQHKLAQEAATAAGVLRVF
jgi:pyridoxine 5'-phosphate synthase PdxJ